MLEPKTEIEECLSDYNSEITVQTGICKFTQFNINKVCNCFVSFKKHLNL